jgi:hypothetical protein
VIGKWVVKRLWAYFGHPILGYPISVKGGEANNGFVLKAEE